MTQFLRAMIAEPAPTGPLRFIASTPGVKRDGAAIDQTMWSLEHYRANPIVLWVHDYWGEHLPIGRATVLVEGEKLIADVEFDQNDDFAKQVESKYRRGYLHAVSVGWDNFEVDGRTMHELLDISAVPVPGDPDALIQRQVRGMRNLQDAIDLVLAAPSLALSPEPEPTLQPDTRSLSQQVADEIELRLGSRAGAVLSQRNKDDLMEAMRLISGVVERSAKPDEPLVPAALLPEEKTQRAAATESQTEDSAALLTLKHLFDSFKI